jgi:hypothetical protein
LKSDSIERLLPWEGGGSTALSPPAAYEFPCRRYPQATPRPGSLRVNSRFGFGTEPERLTKTPCLGYGWPG